MLPRDVRKIKWEKMCKRQHDIHQSPLVIFCLPCFPLRPFVSSGTLSHQSRELHFVCNTHRVPTSASFFPQQLWNVPSPTCSPGAPSVPFLGLVLVPVPVPVPMGPAIAQNVVVGPLRPSNALLQSCPRAGVWWGEGRRQVASCSSQARTDVQSLERNAPKGSPPLRSLPLAPTAFHPAQGLLLGRATAGKALLPTG